MDVNLFQAIYDAMQDGLYAFDKNGKILNVNTAMEKMLGFSKEELVGALGHDLFHLHAFDEQLPIEKCPIYKAFLDSREYQGEEVFRRKDGSHIHVEVSCSIVYQEKKKYGYVVLCKDISKRKKIEQEMISLSKVVEEMQDIIVIKDLDLRVIATNDAFAKISGHKSTDELIGKTDAQIFGVDPLNEPIRSYMEDELEAQTLAPGEYLSKDEPIICPDGEEKYFRTRKFPIFDDHSRVIATANISVDITQQKNYEKLLEKSVEEEIQKRSQNEYFYNKIFETANLGICLTNIEGRFVAVNPAYCNIYGYKEDELVGQHFTKVVPKVNQETMTRLHDDFLIHKKQELSGEWDVLDRHGKKMRILASAGILEDIVGGPYKITTITDITDSHEARRIQQEQQAMLVQQSKLAAMGEMLGSIAHQWRQPLNVMNVTTLDMKFKMQMGLLEEEFLKECIGELEHVTQEMSQTIDDFMDFFKPTKRKEEFSIKDTFEHAYRIVASQMKNSNIHVSVDLDEKLYLDGVKGELEQVFLNLLVNAKDALLERQKDKKVVEIYTDEEDDANIISIQDNAGGIDEAIIEKIFEPYFTTKESHKGTGIGLYMSSMIISKTFGGKLEAKNIYDNGGTRKGVAMRIVVPKTKEKK